jgi:ATP-binding cassette subfamily F protein 3
MAVLNAEGAALESRLSTNPHPSEIAEIGRSLNAVNAELAQLEDRWLDLSSRLEAS